MKIGFIGMGIMGRRMAANLASAGYDLRVYNRTKIKPLPFACLKNAQWMESAKDVAAASDLVFTMLSTPEVVYEVAAGADGFLNAMSAGSLWVDSSTVNPSFSKQMAVLCEEKTIRFLDAPVAGSKQPAEQGELVFLVGGDASAVDECAPLFETMGKKYIHAGENGMGTSFKMVFNLLLGEAMMAFSEGLLLGESLGLSREKMLDVLLQSPVAAPFLQGKRKKLEDADYEPEFPLQWMQKDLHLAAQSAFEQNRALPALNGIKEIYALGKQNGWAEADFSGIYEFLRQKRDRE
ncbi:MAG: NAD(P)-dependent oxidoreductase [Desulfobacterales bacterium]